ncbi:MAG: alpha/beta hydrolase-fold protein [Bacteroidota bacterium]|nr:alpha/beta hydrolase-fold protein [Bacteroidota bacterium]
MPIEKRRGILPERMELESAALGRIVYVDLFFPPVETAPGSLSVLLINDGQDMEELGLPDMLDDLYERNRLRPLLCVGIHAGGQRKMEYGTASTPDYLGRGAKASAYTEFILRELLPALSRQYAPNGFSELAFAGFSLGALSALDIVWNHPHIFNRTGLFSGSFWWRTVDKGDAAYSDEEHRIIHRHIREGQYQPGLKFFFECGTDDETEDRNSNGVIDSIDDTQDLIRELDAKGYEAGRDIFYLEIAGGKHDVATWARAMPQFLEGGWGK